LSSHDAQTSAPETSPPTGPSRRTFLVGAGIASGAAALALAEARPALAATPAAASDSVAPILWTRQVLGARPGEAFQLDGDGFTSASEIRLWRLPTGSGDPLAPATQLGTTPPASAMPLPVLRATADNILTRLPDSVALGVYAIWVSWSGAADWSVPVLVNAAAPWYLDHPSVTPGQLVTVYGENLVLGRSRAQVCAIVGGRTVPLRVADSSPYSLVVEVPRSLAPGSHLLAISNGQGAGYAVDRSLTLAVSAPAVPSTVTLNAVTGFGADPSGGTDSTVALQSALTAAAAAGGVVLQVPAGVYAISTKLRLPASSGTVRIQGAGMGRTTIRMADSSEFPPAVPRDSSFFDVFGVTEDEDFAMLDLAPSDAAVDIDGITFDANDRRVDVLEIDARHHVSVTRSHFVITNWPADANLYSGGHGVLAQSVRDLTIDKCELDCNSGAFLIGILDVRVENSTFRMSYPRTADDPHNFAHQADEDAVKVWGARRLTVRGNTIQRGSATWYYARAVQLGGFKLPPSIFGTEEACGIEDCYFGHNTVLNAGEPNSNNGETLVGDQFNSVVGGRQFLTTASADATTISTAAATFDTSPLGRTNAVGAHVVVMSGRGVGQIRKVVANTETTLTVDAPWDLPPVAGSTFVVIVLHMRQIYHQNTALACPKTMGNYGPGAFCIIADNRMDSRGTVLSNGAPGLGIGVGLTALVSGTPASFDTQHYGQVLDNALTKTYAYLTYQDFATADPAIPPAPIMRGCRVARNDVTENPEAVGLYTEFPRVPAPGVMGAHNMIVNNVSGRGVTVNTRITEPQWFATVCQGTHGSLDDHGEATIVI
jgi:hypothetical protein